MTVDELFSHFKNRLMKLAEGGPHETIDLHEYDLASLESFMAANPYAEYYIPGYSEYPISARVEVFDDDGNVKLEHDYFVVVDVLSRHYGGAEEGGWWYDTGRPAESCRIRVEFSDGGPKLPEASLTVLRDACKRWISEYDFESCHRGSMRPRGPDHGIRVCESEPKEWSNYAPYC